MSHSIVRHLVMKDLRLASPLIVGALALGVLSLALIPWSGLTFFVGGSIFVVAFVLLNVLLVGQSLMSERKEKIRVFLLSLPVSTTEYFVAKLLSSLIAYLVPAVVLTLAAVIFLVATPLPNGFLPLVIATSVHCFFYFCAYLALALITDSQLWMTLVIICGNVSVSFVIPGLINLTSMLGSLSSETPVWGADVLTFIAVELVLSVAALVISFIVNSRKTEFV